MSTKEIASKIIGMNIIDADNFAISHKMILNIIKIDNEKLNMLSNSSNQINVEVFDNVVMKVTSVGSKTYF